MEFFGIAEPVRHGMTCQIAIHHIKHVIVTFSNGFALGCGTRYFGGLPWT
jgi:hypothetical protein